MSTRKRKVSVEETKPTQKEQVEEPQLDKIRAGYVVAIDHNGKFHFNLLGSTTGLVELLGLHEYARLKISKIHDKNTGGDPVTSQVLKVVSNINQKIDQAIQIFHNLTVNKP